MSKTVRGIDALESLGRKSHSKVFPANPIDAEAGKFLSPLIDKEAMLIGGLW
jgi:hypothetical protein